MPVDPANAERGGGRAGRRHRIAQGLRRRLRRRCRAVGRRGRVGADRRRGRRRMTGRAASPMAPGCRGRGCGTRRPPSPGRSAPLRAAAGQAPPAAVPAAAGGAGGDARVRRGDRLGAVRRADRRGQRRVRAGDLAAPQRRLGPAASQRDGVAAHGVGEGGGRRTAGGQRLTGTAVRPARRGRCWRPAPARRPRGAPSAAAGSGSRPRYCGRISDAARQRDVRDRAALDVVPQLDPDAVPGGEPADHRQTHQPERGDVDVGGAARRAAG